MKPQRSLRDDEGVGYAHISEDRSKRPLGILTVRDRVAQTACKMIVEPLFEADFEDCSHGFRPKHSA
jgi:retron-type reverse transcriptase